MTFPAFGAAGTRSSASSGTTSTPALPSGITAGQCLIGIVGTKNNATHNWPAGWTKVDQQNSGSSWTVSWAIRIATGSDSAPAVTWTGSVSNFGKVVRYTGTDPVWPIGAFLHNAGTTSPHSTATNTTTRNSSLNLYLDASAANTALTTPSGYTSRVSEGSATGTTHDDLGDKQVANAGTSSGAISTSGAAAAWVEWQIELLSPLIEARAPTIAPTWRRIPLRDFILPNGFATLLGAVAGAASPFAQSDWPLPARAPRRDATWTASFPLSLVGQDQFFGAPGEGPVYAWPLPRTPERKDRTWLWPSASFLQQQAPFGQHDWPLPRGAAYPAANRIWAQSFPLSLIGQDQFFGAPGQGPTYDWSLPRSAAQPPRSWIWAVLPVPGAVSAAPFVQSDWPLPRARDFPGSLRTWLDSFTLSLAGQDQFFGAPGQAPVYDTSLPRSRARQGLIWTWSSLPLLAPVAAAPFAQADWPLPRGRDFPASLRTWLWSQQIAAAAAAQQPFAQFDWGLPRRAPPFDRTSLYGLPPALLIAPFAQRDWPLPRSGARSTITWAQGPIPSLLVPPFVQRDWPAPRGALRLDRAWVQTPTGLLLPVALPFAQHDWDLPRTIAAFDRTWLQRSAFIPAGATPFFQPSWPLPIIAPYPVGSRTFIQWRVPRPLASQRATLRIQVPRRRIAAPIQSDIVVRLPRRRLVAFARRQPLSTAPQRLIAFRFTPNRGAHRVFELEPPIITGAEETPGWDFGKALADGITLTSVVSITISVANESLAADPDPQARVLSDPVIVTSEDTGKPAAQVNVLFGGPGLVPNVDYIGVCLAQTSDGEILPGWWRWKCIQPS
jgi:hypothetical protein